MNYRCAYLRGACFCLFCFCASISALADSNLQNPSFEFFYDANESPDFNAPTDWERIDYGTYVNSAAVVNQFNTRGTDWKLDFVKGLLPYDGNSFVVLSSMDGGTIFSEIRQEITINVGDRLTGAYFFGTHDYMNYNDWGAIQLVIPDTDTVVGENIVYIDVNEVHNYGSIRGWKKFEYIFDANQAGTYDLRIVVSDFSDPLLASYFAVDGLVICRQSPIFGDINVDCIVNFLDFTMLANDWMCNCNDPNIFNNPNYNCVYGTDFDNSDIVDFNDLQVIADNWLFSTIQGVIEE